MSEITQYFEDLERQLRGLEEVASVKTVSAKRISPGVEEREYEVYLKSGMGSDTVISMLKRDFRVKSVEDNGDHLLVTDSYVED